MGQQVSKVKTVFNTALKNKLTNIFLVLLFMIVIASIFSPYFLTAYNIRVILREAAFIGIVALGQACLLIIGEIDLSVGAVAALSGVIGGIFMVRTSLDPYMIFVLCLILGAFFRIFEWNACYRLKVKLTCSNNRYGRYF